MDKDQRRTPMLAGNFEFPTKGTKESKKTESEMISSSEDIVSFGALCCGMADKSKGCLLFLISDIMETGTSIRVLSLISTGT